MSFPDAMTADQFVAELLNHFRVYHKDGSPEEVMWTRSLQAILSPYKPEVLARTARRILETRKETRFPVPAEITQVCAEIIEEDRRATLPLGQHDTRNEAHSDYRRRDADRWCADLEIGKRAAREGWITGLHDFIVRHGRIPDDVEKKPRRHWSVTADGWLDKTSTIFVTEVEGLKISAREADETLEMCYRGGWQGARAWARTGETMRLRRWALSRRALGAEAGPQPETKLLSPQEISTVLKRWNVAPEVAA